MDGDGGDGGGGNSGGGGNGGGDGGGNNGGGGGGSGGGGDGAAAPLVPSAASGGRDLWRRACSVAVIGAMTTRCGCTASRPSRQSSVGEEATLHACFHLSGPVGVAKVAA